MLLLLSDHSGGNSAIRGVTFDMSGLIRGVVFGWSGLIRGVAFGESAIITGVVISGSGLETGIVFTWGHGWLSGEGCRLLTTNLTPLIR
jgi:hypothetical protein